MLVDRAGATTAPGPANETGQTLTITAVGKRRRTARSIIRAGKVMYTPDADYNGRDSFTYTITDNGTTNGVADPKIGHGHRQLHRHRGQRRADGGRRQRQRRRGRLG